MSDMILIEKLKTHSTKRRFSLIFVNAILILSLVSSCKKANTSDNENLSDSILIVIQGFPKGDFPITYYQDNYDVWFLRHTWLAISAQYNTALDSTRFEFSNDSITGEIQLTGKIPKACISKFHIDSARTEINVDSRKAHFSILCSKEQCQTRNS